MRFATKCPQCGRTIGPGDSWRAALAQACPHCETGLVFHSKQWKVRVPAALLTAVPAWLLGLVVSALVLAVLLPLFVLFAYWLKWLVAINMGGFRAEPSRRHKAAAP